MAARIGRSYYNRPSNIILPKSENLAKQSIKSWLQAVEAASDAEEPNFLELKEVYNSILLDLHLESIIETRILKILQAKFCIKNSDRVETPELVELFEKPWFGEFLKEAMKSKFSGRRVLELWELDEEMHLQEVGFIPEENCNFLKGFFTKEVGDNKGVSYREGAYRDYYIQVGKNRDLGMLKSIAPAAISKRFAISAWLELCEKYGIPNRYVTTNSYSDTRHKQLAEMLAKMVNSHYAVLQGDETINTLNGITGDPTAIFEKLKNTYNYEMSKKVLGHDSAADGKDSKGTYGSMEILQEVSDIRHEADKTFIKDLINKELIPRLIKLSPVYAPLANHKFDWDEFKELSSGQLIDAVGKLSTSGYVVDPQHISEKTGIPIIGLKEATAPPEEKGEKKKSDLTALHTGIFAYYGNKTSNIIIDANTNLLKRDFTDFARSIYYDNNAVKIPFKLCLNLASILESALSKELKIKAIGSGIENAFYAHLRNNIYFFSAAKTFAQYEELSSLLIDEKGKRKNWQNFKDDALKIHEKYNVNYLKAEYNNTGRTAIMAGKWQQFERLKDAYDLQFDTAGDSKVRPHHASLHGITLPVDHPFWDTHYPPLDWNCRCTIRQVAKGTSVTQNKQLQNVEQPPEAFQFNAGKQKRIFHNKHPYIKHISKEIKRELQAVKDYGLPTVNTIYARGKNIGKTIKEATPEEAKNWWNGIQKNGTASLNSKIGNIKHETILSNEVFEKIHKKNFNFIKSLPGTLSNANEVFHLSVKKETIRFIKYFENKKLVADVELKDGKLLINDFFEIVDEVKTRSGALLHTK
jgi:SPP1 gp7 family putative phage head morphogenesis protein